MDIGHKTTICLETGSIMRNPSATNREPIGNARDASAASGQ
jgi:hypothetical protein